MAIAERIRFFRSKRGLTMRALGMLLGFPERSSDVRIAQYEKGVREPKADLINKMAQAFDVSPCALKVPDIDTNIGLMHTLFTLEDSKGIYISELEGEICIRFAKPTNASTLGLYDNVAEWKEEADKLRRGEITQEEYDNWRYTYPKIPSQRWKAAIDELRRKRREAEE